jgi:hypothetical protein
MPEHEVLKDELGYWWIYCGAKDKRYRIDKEPDFCPACGKRVN